MRRLLFWLLCGLSTFPDASLADWQYTRWGMSPAEVVSASHGKATGTSDKHPADSIFGVPLTHLLDADYTAGTFNFQARFYFTKDHKLGMIKLALRKGQRCIDVHAKLSNTYGRSRAPIPKWWDKANGNVLILSDLPDRCIIQYTPLSQPGAKGGL